MKYTCFLILTIILTFISVLGFSQNAELLESLPSTREEFIQSEPRVLATIDWLENTPMNEQADKRKEQSALLIAWLTNSPTVTINLDASVVDFNKKNPELLIIFMGGWTRYALQNNYSKDNVQGSLAGLKSVIKVYKGGHLKKDKGVEKIIAMDDKGELENWVHSKLSK